MSNEIRFMTFRVELAMSVSLPDQQQRSKGVSDMVQIWYIVIFLPYVLRSISDVDNIGSCLLGNPLNLVYAAIACELQY